MGARACLAACPSPSPGADAGGHAHRQRALLALRLVEACPGGALEVIGRQWTPKELFALVARDAVFYETSGGGVTVSGGEPATQPDFLEAFLALCHEGGIANDGHRHLRLRGLERVRAPAAAH